LPPSLNQAGNNGLSIEEASSMQKRLKLRQPTKQNDQQRLIRAIATPLCLGIIGWCWFLTTPGLPSAYGRLPHNDRAALAHPPQNFFVENGGAISVAAIATLLFFKFRLDNKDTEDTNLSGADLSGANFSRVDLSGVDFSGANLSDANLSDANVSGADLSGADLSGADLSGADLSGADLSGASLGGTNLSGADMRYADLSGVGMRYANLSGADMRCTNLSDADLNCALLSDANLSDANLSRALLFFINSRAALNLEPQQLKAHPSPFLCHVALPAYSQQPNVNPNRDCDRIPHLLSARYGIPLAEAQWIVDEARQHRWD
jgi:hypothetical protein